MHLWKGQERQGTNVIFFSNDLPELQLRLGKYNIADTLSGTIYVWIVHLAKLISKD